MKDDEDNDDILVSLLFTAFTVMVVVFVVGGVGVVLGGLFA
jgi:hypothetical protein